ncbi:hypothetical protein IEU95_09950 [Hoyosella rhizosphaerae]|uniref:DNA phosphorothioation-associated protein 4 n=1 Tax=Hoyosella rhizosphaerae TaxID=1755582 RepID=A0A916TZJ0_9ACTN|nr:hypothetical protein [Hoyosella rhizosphaerae]MBN4927156.1 hypothetical protein [Hoyosella rhizosphaerae]GGC53558.1 hypothetical protein GCM10011410_02410 [Hoyosella rhizosphaerae]
MTTVPTDVRIRRPQQHEALMLELQEEAGFTTFRDIMLLAAAIGYHRSRRVRFTETAGDPIRYETLTGPTFSEALINMIAANVIGDDPEIMDNVRIQERVEIFEEYMNGGLEYIQEQVNVRIQTAALVLIDLVSEALNDSSGATAASVDELLGGVSW